jgi:hypothetical protein
LMPCWEGDMKLCPTQKYVTFSLSNCPPYTYCSSWQRLPQARSVGFICK